MKSPIIYKRNTNGTINQWQVIAEDNGFYTIEGLQGGQLTTSKPTTCEGKNIGKENETSPEEQAIKEAQAKLIKKLEKGYTENIKDIDTSKKFFEPMLCRLFEDYKDDLDFSKIIYIQPKLDGMRCVCKSDGMWTRNGKKIVSAPHIYETLKPLFDKNPNLIFDGELYTDKFKYDFNSIISLCKKTKPTEQDLIDSAKSIEYWIYDFPSCEENFGKRSEALKKMLQSIKSSYIKFVDTQIVANSKELDEAFYTAIEAGYEGQIIRLDAPYQTKRSKFILKRKEFKDDEFLVTNCTDACEGKGNRTGTLGFLICQTKDGKEFKTNIKGSYDYLTQLWKDKQNLIGKTVTIKYMNLTPDGIPRFPYVIAIRDYE